jgi:hypothetical protein
MNVIGWRRPFGVAAVVLVLVATTVAACTDEFDSCKETRTCQPASVDGGAAGLPSADGEAGDLTASQAGAGGTRASMGAFAVLSSVPDDEEVEVARDTTVTVTFSAAIDVDSVSNDSFRLVGPSGPVVGRLEVDDAEVSLVPAAPLALFADYQLQLSASLAASNGEELEADQVIKFSTRDGMFGKPKRITSARSVNLRAQGALSGHVLLDWIDSEVPPSRIVSFFDPVSGTWTDPNSIETLTDVDYSSGCVALNDQGDAFALLGPNGQAIWSRATAGKWGSAKSTAAAEANFTCALANDGTAMAIWPASVGEDQHVLSAWLSAQDKWSNIKTVLSKATTTGVARYGSGFLAVLRLTDGGIVSTEYDPATGWLVPKSIVEPGIDINYWSFAALGPAALMTWNGPDRLVYVSSFDGTRWSSQELGPGQSGTKATVSAGGRLAAWLNDGSAYVLRGELDGTWHAPVKLGATNAEVYGPAVTIDSSGNALAAWPNGSSINWRRSLHDSTEWSEVEEMQDQDPGSVFSTVDSGGNVMLIWSNPLGVWASRFE